MRVAWVTLIVLVLLAPFGRVGITATPLDAEMVTAPRDATAAASVRLARDPQPDRRPEAWAHDVLATVVVPFRVVAPRRSSRNIARDPGTAWAVAFAASAEAQPRAPPV